MIMINLNTLHKIIIYIIYNLPSIFICIMAESTATVELWLAPKAHSYLWTKVWCMSRRAQHNVSCNVWWPPTLLLIFTYACSMEPVKIHHFQIRCVLISTFVGILISTENIISTNVKIVVFELKPLAGEYLLPTIFLPPDQDTTIFGVPYQR